MVVGPVEPQHGAPVVQDQHDVVAEIERVPQREEMIALFAVVVAAGSGVRELVGGAHTDQVAGDEPAESFEVRHDISPQIRRRRVAVLEDDRISPALVDIGHPSAEDLGVLQLSVGFCVRHQSPGWSA